MQTEVTTMAYFKIMRSAESDTIVGPMARHTKDHGSRTKWMDRVLSLGKMAKHIQVNLSMISERVKVNSCGQMDASI